MNKKKHANLIKKALEAYNKFELKENGVEIETLEEEFVGSVPILFSSFDAKGYDEEEIEIQVSYDVDKEEYVVEVSDDNGDKEFTVKTSLEDFITDMVGGDWQSLYEYFVEEAREKFGYEYDD